jgi:hypothetical protein
MEARLAEESSTPPLALALLDAAVAAARKSRAFLPRGK